jgi:hypothetical protein
MRSAPATRPRRDVEDVQYPRETADDCRRSHEASSSINDIIVRLKTPVSKLELKGTLTKNPIMSILSDRMP